jgi:glycosyltransferase involved in cell wall biosynthesis
VGDAPRVSVIVPVRDRRDLLRRTLDALAAQTMTDHEVIVVDDGSTDGSADEAERERAAGRPVVVLDAGGRGAVAARTLGVGAASGEVLAFTDSDCEPDPGWLAAGLAGIDAGADLVQGQTVPMGRVAALERSVAVGREDGLYATCNLLIRRAAFDAAGGFDASIGDRYGFRPGRQLRDLGFGEDSLLGWRVRSTGRTAFVPEALVRHHVFRAEPGEVLRRAWNTGGFPALVREAPGLRRTLLRHGVVLGAPTRLPLYAAALAAIAGRRRAAATGACVWAALHAVRVVREEPGWGRRVKVLPFVLAQDAVVAASLVVGSVRARSVVL